MAGALGLRVAPTTARSVAHPCTDRRRRATRVNARKADGAIGSSAAGRALNAHSRLQANAMVSVGRTGKRIATEARRTVLREERAGRPAQHSRGLSGAIGRGDVAGAGLARVDVVAERVAGRRAGVTHARRAAPARGVVGARFAGELGPGRVAGEALVAGRALLLVAAAAREKRIAAGGTGAAVVAGGARVDANRRVDGPFRRDPALARRA